jgi:Zn-dependent protease
MLQLARIRGVPVVVSPSWLLIGLLLTVVYGPVIDDGVPGLGRNAAYVAALGYAVLFALCILAHELGHTLVSTALGYQVRRVVLFMLGGVSEIEGEPSRARDEVLIAAAGPLVSIGLAAGCFAGEFAVADSTLLDVTLALLAWSNAILAVFNLLPGLPLDGGRLLRASIWGFGASALTGTRIAGWAGRVFAVLIAISGIVADRSSVSVATGIVGLVLAAYLWTGATQAIKLAELMTQLPTVTVADLLRPGLLVPSSITVSDALGRVWSSAARGLVLVDTAERPCAIVDESLIALVAPDRRPWTQISDVARPLDDGLVIPQDIDAKELLTRMQETPAHEYLVVGPDGSPAGIIATSDFVRRLSGRSLATR